LIKLLVIFCHGHVQFNKELIDSNQSINSGTINKVNVLPDEDAKIIKKINDQLILNNSNFNTFISDNDEDFKLNEIIKFCTRKFRKRTFN
jgi:hypothetical protein